MPSKSSRSTRSTAATRAAVLLGPPYEVRRSRIQGRGGFAIRAIRKGEVVDEYRGEPITQAEADRREHDHAGRHHTFLFVIDDEIVIDARYGGNDARFLNHSCDPNCETEIVHGRIWIKAIKPIRPEAEITYDYRYEWQDEYEPEDVRYYACRCGTATCRGTILMVPGYLKKTVAEWLKGNDVPKPRKPVKKRSTTAKRTARTQR